MKGKRKQLFFQIKCIGIEYRQKMAKKVSPTPLPILLQLSIGDTDSGKVSAIQYRHRF